MSKHLDFTGRAVSGIIKVKYGKNTASMGEKTKTSFSGDKQPGNRRGKSLKTLALEVFRERSHLELTSKSTKEEAEKAFLHHVAEIAFKGDDPNKGLCLSLLANKCWPNLKPSSESVLFEFSKDAKPHEQAAQVLQAIAHGLIPPDIGNTFVQSIKAMIDIEEYTDLKERIEKLEKALSGES